MSDANLLTHSERTGKVDSAAASPAGAGFPLALTPMERYLIADDRSAYPMSFLIDVNFEGELDRGALDLALQGALARHPLLTSRIEACWGKTSWVGDARTDAPEVQWRDWAESKDIADCHRFHLAVEPPLRVLAGPGLIRIFFSHVACDGIGGFRFVGDLLAIYGQHTSSGKATPKLLPLDSAALRQRGVFDIRLPAPVSRFTAWRATAREAWRLLTRRPAVLHVRHRPDATNSSRRRNFETTLADQDYIALTRRAAALDVSVNDLMLRDMFLTILRWNAGQGREPRRRWLRVTMPTSLRGARDTRMPAANVLGYALITRREDDCRDPHALLAGIARDTKAIVDWKMGAMFVDGLKTAGRVPGALWLGTRALGRMSTTVLSNLGDPTRRFRAAFPREDGLIRAGNLLITRFTGAPPVRPGTRASLALFRYAGQLSIGACVDPRWFHADHAMGLLSTYRNQLEQSAREG